MLLTASAETKIITRHGEFSFYSMSNLWAGPRLVSLAAGCHATLPPFFWGGRGEHCVTSQKTGTKETIPRYAGGILKPNNHRSFWNCVWGKFGKANHAQVVKMFSVHTKTHSRRFQIHAVWSNISNTRDSVSSSWNTTLSGVFLTKFEVYG